MIQITGVDRLAHLSKALKESGDKGLQRELNKAVGKAVAPFKAAVRESALENLPRRGGLNERVAEQVQPRARRANGPKGSGLRVVAAGKPGMRALQKLNDGEVRHQVFGQTETWVTEHIKPGFWTKAEEKVAAQVRADMNLAISIISNKISVSAKR